MSEKFLSINSTTTSSEKSSTPSSIRSYSFPQNDVFPKNDINIEEVKSNFSIDM